MIGYLHGELLSVGETGLVLLTPGGVGYEVAAPTSVLAKLPGRGKEVRLYVHTQVGEKAIDLFGFLEADDLDLFRTLISIDKLGPKKALAILSMFDAAHLREIAFREDVTTLSTVPGIGPKSAKQILWNLKDKVDKLTASTAKAQSAPAGTAGRIPGYPCGAQGVGLLGEDEIRPMMIDTFDEEPDLDAAGAIRAVLKKINAARS